MAASQNPDMKTPMVVNPTEVHQIVSQLNHAIGVVLPSIAVVILTAQLRISNVINAQK